MVYHYETLEKDIERLLKTYPSLTCQVAGKSVLGRNLYELTWGDGKEIIHYNASFHANEWITSSVLMEWVGRFLESGKGEYTGRSLSLVPMVNPDGIQLLVDGEAAAKGVADVAAMNEGRTDFCSWKANIMGIDLNKQYPANWDVYKRNVYCQKPYYRDFPGWNPLTEPEATAMKNLTEQRDFSRVAALHTQGEEFYWGYCLMEPDESETIAAALEKAGGLKSVRNVKSHAGYRDWFISAYKRPGFTLELGKGINPLPLSQFEEICRRTFPVLDTIALV